MEDNIEMLNYIYQNVSMGTDSLKQIIDKNKDEIFGKVLKEQYDDYRKVKEDAYDILNENNERAKDVSGTKKTMTDINISLSLMKDDSISHMAEMLILGSTMGTIDVTKRLNQYDTVDRKISSLADKLLNVEQKNIEKLKPFL